MRMQSSSESGRVASCLPIGTTSSKTNCVRSRNGRSVQHPKPKQIPAPATVEDTRRTIVVLLLRVCNYLHSQLRCVKTFGRCSRAFAVQIVAYATTWAMYVFVDSKNSIWGVYIVRGLYYFFITCITFFQTATATQ